MTNPNLARENPLHQLSPYIGKIKSHIARDLIERYSSPNGLVVDPFCGSGTIPLEAAFAGRRTMSGDISPYAMLLTSAKTTPPTDLETAMFELGEILEKSKSIDKATINTQIAQSPEWVKKFFHPETFKEIISVVEAINFHQNDFLMACLLGILHHQRPGFLSYPSSHLVPYLRDKKFPRTEFPELYSYRSVATRLEAKVKRAMKRRSELNSTDTGDHLHLNEPIEKLEFPENVDAVITSPPYMNALDYVRDNRLRIWLISRNDSLEKLNEPTSKKSNFEVSIKSLARKSQHSLIKDGKLVIVVGDTVKKSKPLSEQTIDLVTSSATDLVLESKSSDLVPDIRRSRRDCRSVRTEVTLVFNKYGI